MSTILYLYILIVVQAYGNSKASQIMFGEHLAREIEARGANVKIIRFNDARLNILIVQV